MDQSSEHTINIVVFSIGTTRYSEHDFRFQEKKVKGVFPAEVIGNIVNADGFFLMGTLSLLERAELSEENSKIKALEAGYRNKEIFKNIAEKLTVSLAPNNLETKSKQPDMSLLFEEDHHEFYVYSFFKIYEYFNEMLEKFQKVNDLKVYCDLSTGLNWQAYSVARITKDVLAILHISGQIKIELQILNSDPIIGDMEKVYDIRLNELVTYGKREPDYLQIIYEIFTNLDLSYEDRFERSATKILSNKDQRNILRKYKTLKVLKNSIENGLLLPILYFHQCITETFEDVMQDIVKTVSNADVFVTKTPDKVRIKANNPYKEYDTAVTHIFTIIRIITADLFRLTLDEEDYAKFEDILEASKKLDDKSVGTLLLKDEINKLKNGGLEDLGGKPPNRRNIYAHAGLEKNIIELHRGGDRFRYNIKLEDLLQYLGK